MEKIISLYGMRIVAIHNNQVIGLPIDKTQKKLQDNPVYNVKGIPVRSRLLIECAEEAEYDPSLNNWVTSCTVVCGLAGNKLHPHNVPNTPELSDRSVVYARFRIPEAVVTVTVWDKTHFIIYEHHICLVDCTAYIETKKLCGGNAKIIERLCTHCGTILSNEDRIHFNKHGGICPGPTTITKMGFDLPNQLKRFRGAVEAAIEKFGCHKCTHVHYTR